MSDDVERRLAMLEAELKVLRRDNDEMRDDVRIIRDIVVAAGGGWKTMLALGGLASFIGTVAGWFGTSFGFLPRP